MKIPKVTLEQWAAFKAVVDEGSFAKAAEILNKSQSTISYAVGRMSEQLPVELFRQQGRRAELTEEGRSIYRHARQILDRAGEAELAAGLLAAGWEPEITLAVDIIVSLEPIFRAMEVLSREAPMTRVRLLETSLSATDEALLDRRADLVITTNVPPGFLGTPLAMVRMVPVARRDHPLFELGEGISSSALKEYRQIVVRDTGVRHQKDSGWLGSEQRWTVSHFSTSIQAVKAGFGFAFLPETMVRRQLAKGSLARLPIAQRAERRLEIYLVMASEAAAGPAARVLSRTIIDLYRSQPDSSVADECANPRNGE